MKKNSLLFIMIISCFLVMNLKAQNLINHPQIYFTNPTDGQIVTATGYGSTESTVPLNLQYYVEYSGAYYVKLFPPPYPTQQSNVGNGISQWWYLPIGSYGWRLELWAYNEIGQEFEVAEQSITFYVKHTLNVSNNFGGGTINIDGITKPGGSDVIKTTGENLLVGAIDQSHGDYNYIWNQSGINNSFWQRKGMNDQNFSPIPNGTPRNFNYTVASNDNGAAIQGVLRKVCLITFQNNFINVGNGGIINVNGTQYNSPTSPFNVTESNPITAWSTDQTFNGINYEFDHWSDGNTDFERTFYPSANTTYTAYFTGYPDAQAIAFGFDKVVGQPIKFHWTDNPNTGVNQYQIWRIVKPSKTDPADTALLATVGRGVETFTDGDYNFTGGYTNALLSYDVRQYYSTEHTYSEPYWHTTTGIIAPKENAHNNNSTEAITEYALGCYPNPFNPSTTISYQIPKDGLVTLNIYDMLGRKINTLVNKYQSVGKYEVNFNAANLSSGVYIYLLRSGDFTLVKKMLLVR
jgi:Secretion system C-terminal sorting domain